jgi:cell division protein FtsI/penicillin-binding protein 2
MVQKDDSKPNINICATTNGYEPGSIFKTIVSEAVLEKDESLKDKYYECIEEGHRHGKVNMQGAYIVSCNTYFSNIGCILGANNILNMSLKQGIFNKVLNFYNEARGVIALPKNKNIDRMDEVQYVETNYPEAMLGIGQSMSITPIQAINMVNTVINKGTYVKPYLIDHTEKNGRVINTYTSNKSVVLKESTANFVKDEMIQVVKFGTAMQAYIQGTEVGGKTGTSTRYDEKGNKHSDGWFIGFFNKNDKYYSAVIYVQDINVQSESGGTIAAPIFKEIVDKL